MSVALAPATKDRHAAVAIENGAGAGDFVLLCDHAAHAIPIEYAGLGLDEVEQRRHIGWDIGALGLSRALSRKLDAPLIHTTFSRLLLDVNRHPDAHDAIATESEDTPIPGNFELSAGEREHRRRWIYEPYHASIEALIASRLSATQPAGALPTCVVAIHSFTPAYRGLARPWHVGVLSQHDRRMADPLLAALRERHDAATVGDNEPYAPAQGVYHTLERHAEAHGLPCVMLEIRNDLIRDLQSQEVWADRLAPLLQSAFEAVGKPSFIATPPPQS